SVSMRVWEFECVQNCFNVLCVSVFVCVYERACVLTVCVRVRVCVCVCVCVGVCVGVGGVVGVSVRGGGGEPRACAEDMSLQLNRHLQEAPHREKGSCCNLTPKEGKRRKENKASVTISHGNHRKWERLGRKTAMACSVVETHLTSPQPPIHHDT